MTGPRVSVLGSCNMDLVAVTQRAPKLGETVQGERFLTVPGGKGANQAIAAARAGGQVTMIGAVGSDHYGTTLRDTLAAAGVSVAQLREVAGPTGTAHITVDGQGRNAIVVVPSANASMTGLAPGDAEVIAAGQVLLTQLEVPLAGVVAGAAEAHRRSVTVVLTPAPVRPLPDELLANVDLVVANEYEAAELGGGTDEEQALGGLLGRVPQAVVTLGSAGCLYGSRDGSRIRVPTPTVDVVDTTAAGDSFVGALSVALAEGVPIIAALRWATAAAALTVQREGASSSLPRRTEIAELADRLAQA